MLIDVVLRALRVSCKCFKHWPAAFDSRCRKCEYVNVQFMKPHHSQTVSFRLVHSYQRVSHSMDSREVWFEVLYENLVWKSFMKIVKFDLRSCMKIWYENREVWFQVMYENRVWKSCMKIVKFDWRSCMKILCENLSQTQIWLKSGWHIGHFDGDVCTFSFRRCHRTSRTRSWKQGVAQQ